jgi:hypothetical protein
MPKIQASGWAIPGGGSKAAIWPSSFTVEIASPEAHSQGLDQVASNAIGPHAPAMTSTKRVVKSRRRCGSRVCPEFCFALPTRRRQTMDWPRVVAAVRGGRLRTASSLAELQPAASPDAPQVSGFALC